MSISYALKTHTKTAHKPNRHLSLKYIYDLMRYSIIASTFINRTRIKQSPGSQKGSLAARGFTIQCGRSLWITKRLLLNSSPFVKRSNMLLVHSKYTDRGYHPHPHAPHHKCPYSLEGFAINVKWVKRMWAPSGHILIGLAVRAEIVSTQWNPQSMCVCFFIIFINVVDRNGTRLLCELFYGKPNQP